MCLSIMMDIFVKPSFAFYIFVALNHFNIPNVDKGGVCVSVTTVVTAPLDSQRREGGRPSAIKIQFAKGPQWIHDNQQRGRMVEFIVVP